MENGGAAKSKALKYVNCGASGIVKQEKFMTKAGSSYHILGSFTIALKFYIDVQQEETCNICQQCLKKLKSCLQTAHNLRTYLDLSKTDGETRANRADPEFAVLNDRDCSNIPDIQFRDPLRIDPFEQFLFDRANERAAQVEQHEEDLPPPPRQMGRETRYPP